MSWSYDGQGHDRLKSVSSRLEHTLVLDEPPSLLTASEAASLRRVFESLVGFRKQRRLRLRLAALSDRLEQLNIHISTPSVRAFRLLSREERRTTRGAPTHDFSRALTEAEVRAERKGLVERAGELSARVGELRLHVLERGRVHAADLRHCFASIGAKRTLAECEHIVCPLAYKLSHLRLLNRMRIISRKRCARKFDES